MFVSHFHKVYIFPLDECRFQSNKGLSINNLDPHHYGIELPLLKKGLKAGEWLSYWQMVECKKTGKCPSTTYLVSF